MERILSEVEQGEDGLEREDGQVLRVLDEIGEQMDGILDGAEVHDAGGMQSVMLRLLRLLTGVARSTESGRDGPADPRILQVFPPLAAAEGGEGGY